MCVDPQQGPSRRRCSREREQARRRRLGAGGGSVPSDRCRTPLGAACAGSGGTRSVVFHSVAAGKPCRRPQRECMLPGNKQTPGTDLDMEAGSHEPWPVVVVDALDALQALDPSFPRRRASLFQPLLTPHAATSAKAQGKSRPMELHAFATLVDKTYKDRTTHIQDNSTHALVENEPGLCEQMERAHANLRLRRDVFCAAWRIRAGRNGPKTEAPQLPPLASLVRSQLRGARRRHRTVLLSQAGACCSEGCRGAGVGARCVCDACAGARTLTAPLLFGSLIRNDFSRPARLSALGCEWLLPRHCAFSLSLLEGWRDLARSHLMPREGFQLILLDPPWPSRSVHRAGTYQTATLPQLAAQLPLPELCDRRGCLLAIWLTNDIKVLAFMENVLLPQWGARKVGMWYWLKVAADGQPSVGSMRSPHRKPWEPLLLAMVGGHRPQCAGSGSSLTGAACMPPLPLLPARCAGNESPSASPGAASIPSQPLPARRVPSSAPTGGHSATSMPSLPLPARQVLCSVPTGGHSTKPSIDALLRPAAAYLLSLGRGAQQSEDAASSLNHSSAEGAECGAKRRVLNSGATLSPAECGARQGVPYGLPTLPGCGAEDDVLNGRSSLPAGTCVAERGMPNSVAVRLTAAKCGARQEVTDGLPMLPGSSAGKDEVEAKRGAKRRVSNRWATLGTGSECIAGCRISDDGASLPAAKRGTKRRVPCGLSTLPGCSADEEGEAEDEGECGAEHRVSSGLPTHPGCAAGEGEAEAEGECGAGCRISHTGATIAASLERKASSGPPTLLEWGAGEAEAEELAWRKLRKCELFARELRPFWYSLGDEVLRFQHGAWFQSQSASRDDEA
jgi:N6-adenosine-specific RNA methylase IME4